VNPDWDAWARQIGSPGGRAQRPPAPIVPVPAAARRRELRGRRVIVGLPGLGWRSDLRADDAVVQASRTYVPVLAEHEWYRAEAEQVEVFAPLMPIERVWLEAVDPSAVDGPGERLVSLDAPPRQEPAPIRDLSRVTGRRLVRMTDDGTEQRDLRAVTEPYTGTGGDICVRVAPELDWYRWVWSGHAPTTTEVPGHVIWAE
jgi:hypothetical protein